MQTIKKFKPAPKNDKSNGSAHKLICFLSYLIFKINLI